MNGVVGPGVRRQLLQQFLRGCHNLHEVLLQLSLREHGCRDEGIASDAFQGAERLAGLPGGVGKTRYEQQVFLGERTVNDLRKDGDRTLPCAFDQHTQPGFDCIEAGQIHGDLFLRHALLLDRGLVFRCQEVGNWLPLAFVVGRIQPTCHLQGKRRILEQCF